MACAAKLLRFVVARYGVRAAPPAPAPEARADLGAAERAVAAATVMLVGGAGVAADAGRGIHWTFLTLSVDRTAAATGSMGRPTLGTRLGVCPVHLGVHYPLASLLRGMVYALWVISLACHPSYVFVIAY
jgi:hypothetical protein